MSISLENLILLNEKNKLKSKKYGFDKVPNKVFRINKHGNEYFLESKEGIFSKLESLSDIRIMLQNEMCFISNISVLKKIGNDILSKYVLSKDDCANIRYVINTVRDIDNFKIIKLDNMGAFVGRQILLLQKNFKILLEETCFIIYKVKNDVILCSDVKLKMKGTNLLSLGGLSVKNMFIENLDVSEVTTLKHMFSSCSNTESIVLNNFDTRNVVDFTCMFSNCIALKKVNLNEFNTSKGQRFAHMFFNCTSLEKLDLNNFDMKNALYLQSMFENCVSLTELKIEHWLLDSDKRIEKYNIFENTPLLRLRVLNYRI